MQTTIRAATPDDALCISVLAMQVFLDTYATDGIRPDLARELVANYSPEVFTALLEDTSRNFFVAEANGYLVAFAEYGESYSQPHTDLVNGLELFRLYVLRSMQRQGIGKRLIALTERHTAQRGYQQLWLTAWSGNATARAFYLANGYADIGATDYHIDGQAYENRIFTKRIEAHR